MGLVIIFGIVSLLAGYGALSALKKKNLMGIFFGAGSFFVFGWFTIMTVMHNGFPPSGH